MEVSQRNIAPQDEHMTVAILLTTFNRRERTLACLRNCFEQIDSLRVDNKYSVSIYLTDDGSEDGTYETVSSRFPEVHIIKGDGQLYWNQGMRAAWAEAAKEDYDFYLWLNVHTTLRQGALATLLENSYYLRHRAIVVGTAVNSDGEYSCGGRTRSGKIVAPDPTIPVPCDMFNGNVVLVPKSVYNAVGMMDVRYTHGYGDYDYGVRADKVGIVSVVAPGVMAECDRETGIPKWRDGSYPLKERIQALRSPKGRPLKEQFLFDTRLHNVFTAGGHCASLLLKTVFARKPQ